MISWAWPAAVGEADDADMAAHADLPVGSSSGTRQMISIKVQRAGLHVGHRARASHAARSGPGSDDIRGAGVSGEAVSARVTGQRAVTGDLIRADAFVGADDPYWVLRFLCEAAVAASPQDMTRQGMGVRFWGLREVSGTDARAVPAGGWPGRAGRGELAGVELARSRLSRGARLAGVALVACTLGRGRPVCVPVGEKTARFGRKTRLIPAALTGRTVV